MLYPELLFLLSIMGMDVPEEMSGEVAEEIGTY